MTGALLDVNTLLALAWPNHQFHDPARRWFRDHTGSWSTCAVTQLGFVRLSSNPAFTDQARSPEDALALLQAMCAHPRHCYVSETEALTESGFQAIVERMLGHQQVTDGCLLAIAQSKTLELVTFDRRLVFLAGEGAQVLLLSG
jgi:toxin-antitoxin system PIN domain toxin